MICLVYIIAFGETALLINLAVLSALVGIVTSIVALVMSKE